MISRRNIYRVDGDGDWWIWRSADQTYGWHLYIVNEAPAHHGGMVTTSLEVLEKTFGPTTLTWDGEDV